MTALLKEVMRKNQAKRNHVEEQEKMKATEFREFREKEMDDLNNNNNEQTRV